jgi:hypothetical protein
MPWTNAGMMIQLRAAAHQERIMTVQGFLFGLAAFLAVAALSPSAPTKSEGQIKIAMTVAVGLLVAVAASLR